LDYDIENITDWYTKKIHILSTIDKFSWGDKRDFKLLLDNIDKIVVEWEQAKIRHKTTRNSSTIILVEECENRFKDVIKLLKKELIISKLYS